MTIHPTSAIIKIPNEEGTSPRVKKKNFKKLKKPLDKPLRVWYNKGTKGEGRNGRTEAHESDVRRNPTKTPTARCVGLRYTNVNQCRFAEVMTDDAYYKAKKTFKKPLDKALKMWYNESTKRGREVLPIDLLSPLPLNFLKKVEKTS